MKKSNPLGGSKSPHRLFCKNKCQKALLGVVLVAFLSNPAFAQAQQAPKENKGIFEPLLRILLPFYKKNNSPDDDVPPQEIDDGTDDYYQPPPYPTPLANPALPPALLDDSLVADDSLFMLGEPDLLALLSAEFEADRGNVVGALTVYKTESFKKNATGVFERALSLSLEYEKPQDSLSFATAWQKKNPEHIPAWFYVAHLALKAGDYNQASQTLAMILAYDPTADLTQILTGIIPNDPNRQRELFDALTQMGDDNPSISVLRAGLLMRLGDYEPALLHMNSALKKDPKNPAYISLKMDLLKASKKEKQLWQFVQAKRKELPTHTELHLYEIRHLINQGQLQKAWQLSKIATKATQDPEVALLTALLGLDIGKHKEVRAILQTLLPKSEFNSRANYYMAIAYEKEGNTKKAREHYEKVKDYEHVLDARTKVVGFYLLDNDVKKAIATLVRLRDEYEIYATDSYILQAEILMRQGEKKQAENLLIVANREHPDDDRLLFASFKLLENELSDDDKQISLKQLLEINPYNTEYQLEDAKLRLKRNPDDKKALATATKISKIGVDDPEYDSELQLQALLVIANNALTKKQYAHVIDLLQMSYDVAPNLEMGILLLRAHQGLGQNEKVMVLLKELQDRFSFGQNKVGDESQSY